MADASQLLTTRGPRNPGSAGRRLFWARAQYTEFRKAPIIRSLPRVVSVRASRFITLGLVLILSACSPSRPSGEPLVGDVSDPAGDTQTGTSPVRPDLVRASIEVTFGEGDDVEDAEVHLAIRVVPGTFNINTGRILVHLDVDESPATGVPAAPGLTVDYWVDISGGRAALFKCPLVGDAVCAVVDDGLTLSLAPEGPAVVLPLGALGDDDGRMSFRVVAAPLALLTATDFLPDVGLPPARVR